MAINISDDYMSLRIGSTVIATAARTDDWWIITNWARYFSRNQATTALTLAERLEAGHAAEDPPVIAWRKELRRG